MISYPLSITVRIYRFHSILKSAHHSEKSWERGPFFSSHTISLISFTLSPISQLHRYLQDTPIDIYLCEKVRVMSRVVSTTNCERGIGEIPSNSLISSFSVRSHLPENRESIAKWGSNSSKFERLLGRSHDPERDGRVEGERGRGSRTLSPLFFSPILSLVPFTHALFPPPNVNQWWLTSPYRAALSIVSAWKYSVIWLINSRQSLLSHAWG